MSKLLVFGKAANGAESRRRRRFARRSTSVWTTIASFRRHILFVVLGLVLGVTVTGSGPALSGPPSANDVVAVTTFGSRRATCASRPSRSVVDTSTWGRSAWMAAAITSR